MPSIQLKSIYCYGLNLPADGGRSGSLHTDPTFVWLRYNETAYIELNYELSTDNMFVAVPNMSGLTVVTKGSNSSKKFKIILSGGRVTADIAHIARQADTKGVTARLKTYANIHRQVRLEAARQGSQRPSALTPMGELMPINNLAVYGLDVPFATHKRTYIVDGIELMIVGSHGDPDALRTIDRSARLVTVVEAPRNTIVAVRKGYRLSDRMEPNRPLGCYIRPNTSKRLKAQHTISLRGKRVEDFMAANTRHTSPREVLAALRPLLRELQSNFRIKEPR